MIFAVKPSPMHVPAWPHPRVATMKTVAWLIASMVFGAAGCAGPQGPTAGASPGPTATAAATHPEPTSASTTAPPPSRAPLDPSTITGQVLLRVFVYTDVGPQPPPWPELALYEDGTVNQPFGGLSPALERGSPGLSRLSSTGIDRVLAVLGDDDFVADSDIGRDPDWRAGWVTYRIDLRDSGGVLQSRTVVDPADPRRVDDARAFIALANRLLGLRTWLPKDAWAAPTIEPWVPGQYLLKLWLGLGDAAPGSRDVAALSWPLDVEPSDFGTEIPLDAQPGRALRCGVVSLDIALALQDVLRPDGDGAGLPTQLSIFVGEGNIAWRHDELVVVLEAVPPEGPFDCSLDPAQYPV